MIFRGGVFQLRHPARKDGQKNESPPRTNHPGRGFHDATATPKKITGRRRTFDSSDGFEFHFLPDGEKIKVQPPSSRRQATVHRTVAFRRVRIRQRKIKTEKAFALSVFMVRVTGFEPAAS